MRGAAIVATIIAIAALSLGPAHAEGKDPFLPPAGAGAQGTGSDGVADPGPGAFPGPEVEPGSDGDLARTGQDVDFQLGVAVAFVCFGAALRILAFLAGAAGLRGPLRRRLNHPGVRHIPYA